MDIGTITMEHELDRYRFLNAFLEADDVGAIIRCHYEAERALDYVLDKLTDGRSNRNAKNWAFAMRLEVCRLLGVQDMWTAPLKTINDHRNDFAHRGKDSLADQQILDLYHQVRRFYPRFDGSFRTKFHGTRSIDKTFAECSNKEKYVMMVMVVTGFFSSLPQIAAKAGVVSEC